MPCEIDNACTEQGANQPGRVPTKGDAIQFANMGWTGYVKLTSALLNATQGVILRVNSCDVNLKQEIIKPDVIDGRIDKTVYQLGPKLVDGTLSLPVVADSTGIGGSFASCPDNQDLQNSAGALLNALWCWSTSRGSQGRMVYGDVDLDIRYANHAAFRFKDCIANTFGISVTQGDMISMDINVIGRTREFSINSQDSVGGTLGINTADMLSPARVLTWNDISVNALGRSDGCTPNGNDLLFSSPQARAFDFEVNNNADRFYTLNGFLFPIDINVGKREITGTLTLMGLSDELRQYAEDNQNRFTSKAVMRMAMYVGSQPDSNNTRDWLGSTPGADSLFYKEFTGTIFEIEELSLTNNIMETTVNWHALANDAENYEAVNPCTAQYFPNWA